MSGNDTITKRCLSDERGDLMPIVISLAAVIGVLMTLIALTFIYTLQNKYVVLIDMLVNIPIMQVITGIPRNTQLKYPNHWEGNSQHIKWIALDVIYAGEI